MATRTLLRRPAPRPLSPGPAIVAVLLACTPVAVPAQPSAAPGFACVVLGRAGSQMRVGTAVVEAPVRLPSCEGAKALAEGLSVCFLNDRRERRCRDLRNGEVVTLSALGGTTAAGVGDTIVAMARGDVQTLPGQTRNNGRVAGLPFGQVLGDDTGLAFDFSMDKRAQGSSRLVLTPDTDGGPTLWESAVHQAVLTAPLTGLRPDTWYRWTAETNNGRLSGRFMLMGAALDGARAELRRIAAETGLSAQARAYLKAEVYNDAGLMHERHLAVAEVRRLAQSP